jgi:hypothetical protein
MTESPTAVTERLRAPGGAGSDEGLDSVRVAAGVVVEIDGTGEGSGDAGALDPDAEPDASVFAPHAANNNERARAARTPGPNRPGRRHLRSVMTEDDAAPASTPQRTVLSTSIGVRQR